MFLGYYGLFVVGRGTGTIDEQTGVTSAFSRASEMIAGFP